MGCGERVFLCKCVILCVGEIVFGTVVVNLCCPTAGLLRILQNLKCMIDRTKRTISVKTKILNVKINCKYKNDNYVICDICDVFFLRRLFC